MAAFPDTPIGPLVLDPVPDFEQMLQDIVGNAGDPTDGFPELLADWAQAIEDTANEIGAALGALDDGVQAFSEVDNTLVDQQASDAVTGTQDIATSLASLDQHFAQITEPPSPPQPGGPSGGQQYNDTQQFPAITENVTPQPVLVPYTYTNTTDTEQRLDALVVLGLGFGPVPPPTPTRPPAVASGGPGIAQPGFRQSSGGVSTANNLPAPSPVGVPSGPCNSPGTQNCNWYVADFVPQKLQPGKALTWHVGFTNYDNTGPGTYQLGWGPADLKHQILFWSVLSTAVVEPGPEVRQPIPPPTAPGQPPPGGGGPPPASPPPPPIRTPR